jgi:hypothetical protein
MWVRGVEVVIAIVGCRGGLLGVWFCGWRFAGFLDGGCC